TGEQTLQDIVLNDLDWYRENNVTLHLNTNVIRINRARKEVDASNGITADYDRLLLANGSHPIILPVPGHDLNGVITFRDIRDVNLMIDAASRVKHAVVIGGGLLGLEAANGLAVRGMDVSVVHLGSSLLDRQLDDTAAALLQKRLEERGLAFLMQRQTQAILGDAQGNVRALRFQDGSEINTELVVMAVGIRPNADLAASAGIHTDRGIVVNDTLQTFDPS